MAQVKYDGSNIRAEFSLKSGWYKFGTRTRLFDKFDPDFGGAIDIFHAKYADKIAQVVATHPSYKKVDRLIAYMEFVGPRSFAGKHHADDPKDLILFDVNVHKKGFVAPRDFIDHFGGRMEIPKVVYEGPFSAEFVQDVRDGKYPVVEGVIAKGGSGHSFWMRKVKTLSYLQKLKEMHGENWKNFWE